MDDCPTSSKYDSMIMVRRRRCTAEQGCVVAISQTINSFRLVLHPRYEVYARIGVAQKQLLVTSLCLANSDAYSSPSASSTNVRLYFSSSKVLFFMYTLSRRAVFTLHLLKSSHRQLLSLHSYFLSSFVMYSLLPPAIRSSANSYSAMISPSGSGTSSGGDMGASLSSNVAV